MGLAETERTRRFALVRSQRQATFMVALHALERPKRPRAAIALSPRTASSPSGLPGASAASVVARARKPAQSRSSKLHSTAVNHAKEIFRRLTRANHRMTILARAPCQWIASGICGVRGARAHAPVTAASRHETELSRPRQRVKVSCARLRTRPRSVRATLGLAQKTFVSMASGLIGESSVRAP